MSYLKKLLRPENWPEVREECKKRDGFKCSKCGLPGETTFYTDRGFWVKYPEDIEEQMILKSKGIHGRYSVVCATAMNGNYKDTRPENIKFLCGDCKSKLKHE